MNLQSIRLVATQEFQSIMLNKVLWLSLLAVPIMIGLMIYIPIQLAGGGKNDRYLIVADQTGEYFEAIQLDFDRQYGRLIMRDFNSHLRQNAKEEFRKNNKLDDTKIPYEFLKGTDEITDRDVDLFWQQGGAARLLLIAPAFVDPEAPPFVPVPRITNIIPPPEGFDISGTAEQVRERASAFLTGGKKVSSNAEQVPVLGVLFLPKNARIATPGTAGYVDRGPEDERVHLWMNGAPPRAWRERFDASLKRITRSQDALSVTGDPDLADRLRYGHLPFEGVDISDPTGANAAPRISVNSRLVAVLITYLLWMVLLMSGYYLMSSATEEKGGRIFESLLTSVTARELMTGKLLGVAAVALTIVALCFGALLMALPLLEDGYLRFVEGVWQLLSGATFLPLLLVYFLLGYALYGAIYLAIGAMCETVKEANAAAFPLMILLIGAILTQSGYLQNPSSTLFDILIWVPFFTPFLMIGRLPLEPSVWVILGTIAVLTVSVALVLIAAGRLYRHSVLGPAGVGSFRRVLKLMTNAKSS